jgi:hypothetical protein
MRSLTGVIGVVLITLGALPASPGDFDGSKLLICAPVEAQDCAAGAGCAQGTPEEIGAPAFVRIDFTRKALVGPKRTAQIQSLERSDRQLLLQGTELGYGWTLALDQETGKIAITLVSREGVFVLFGACTPP